MKSNKWNPTVKYGARAQPGSLQHGMERVRAKQEADRAAAKSATANEPKRAAPERRTDDDPVSSTRKSSLNKLFKRR